MLFMGQWWQIINLDKRETLARAPPRRPAPALEASRSPPPSRPPRRPLPERDEPAPAAAATYAPRALGRLQPLPAELLLLVFDHVDDLIDVLSLRLAHPVLFDAGRHRADALYAAEMARWAGDRLLCVGDGAQRADAPPGVLAPGELGGREGASLYELSDDWPGLRHAHGLERILRRYPWRPRPATPDGWHRGTAKRILRPVYKAQGAGAHWALCNLSKREYVREDALVVRAAPDAARAPVRFGFGQALLSRICWSSQASTTMAYQGSIHRGVWAGDRFAITEAERLPGFAQPGLWRDVSEEVRRELEALWRSEYGSAWADELERDVQFEHGSFTLQTWRLSSTRHLVR
ncbi:hypothetical protein BC834DRAFT_971354 [Gloeopeniophorella convolvens]|nr:hypothetical protein BC834DRAFT_971354 [Gloeopeniophorella convolvens]